MKTTSIFNHFAIALLLIGIAGCQNNTNQTTSDTTEFAEKAKVVKVASVSNCDSTIINQEFGFDILAFNVFKADTNKLKSLFLEQAVLKMEKHINDQGETHYLYNFTDGVNKIVLLNHPGEGFYIENADIKNNKVQLTKKILIGMNKADFLKLVNIKTFKCDTVVVHDDEMSFENVYIFKDAKLNEIKMGQTVE